MHLSLFFPIFAVPSPSSRVAYRSLKPSRSHHSRPKSFPIPFRNISKLLLRNFQDAAPRSSSSTHCSRSRRRGSSSSPLRVSASVAYDIKTKSTIQAVLMLSSLAHLLNVDPITPARRQYFPMCRIRLLPKFSSDLDTQRTLAPLIPALIPCYGNGHQGGFDARLCLTALVLSL
ncbi:hypothetical protein B0H11DRAFT_2291957, partial [Mycena galericulata]